MPDPGAVIASLAVALLAAFMLQFALGTHRNVRRGNDVLRWLQGGLPLLGRRTTLRWLGSSAVELGIVETNDPIRDATVLVVLEPRDVSWLWAFSRARGRRDFILVRCSLRRAPRIAVEVAARAAWTGGAGFTPRAEGEEDWRARDWSDAATVVRLGSDAGEADARRWWQELDRASGGAWRLSIRRTVPHLEVHVLPPPAFDSARSERLLRTVRDIAVEVSRER
jgi:hypothetical protein